MRLIERIEALHVVQVVGILRAKVELLAEDLTPVRVAESDFDQV